MTENWLLRGDSLEALTRLRKEWSETVTGTQRVKMIYIDPPYNTGNAFAYCDARNKDDWATMMRARLEIARDLLRDDGMMFISIDFNQLAELKLICDGVFGAENLVANFVWVANLKGRQFGIGPAGTHEYILTYARNAARIGKLYGSVSELTALMPAVYALPTRELRSDARGEYVLKNQLYNTNSRFNEVTAPSMVYLIHWNQVTGEVRTSEVPALRAGTSGADRENTRGESTPEEVDFGLAGKDWVTAWPHPNARPGLRYHAWRWSRNKVETDYEDLEFVVDTTGGLQIWTKVRDFDRTRLKDLIMGPSTVTGQKELERLGLGGIFETPKPVELLKVLIRAATKPGDLVLDFFAGSGSFGQAAAETGRSFILVQLEEIFAGERAEVARRLDLENIADLAAARLRAAGVEFQEQTLS